MYTAFSPPPESIHHSFHAHSWSRVLMVPAAPTTPTHLRIVQDRQDMLRPNPTLDISLFIYDTVRRFHQSLVLNAPCAEFAFSMRGNFRSNRRGPQVRNI